MIDVNIKDVLYGIAAALPYTKEQESGHIINVSFVAGHKVGPGFAVYAATKFAVRALSEVLRFHQPSLHKFSRTVQHLETSLKTGNGAQKTYPPS